VTGAEKAETGRDGRQPVRVSDPPGGTVLAAPAGERAEALFNFVNASLNEARRFHLEVEGQLDPDWLRGAGSQAARVVAAGSGGSLLLALMPPARTPPGDYNLRVRIVDDGGPIAADVPLVLRVQPGAEQAALPARDEPRIEPPATVPAHRDPERLPARVNLPPAGVQIDEDGNGGERPDPILDPPDSILDPPEGALLAVRPGETLLVRFGFTNSTRQDQTYVIDEDRALDPGWITLPRDKINVTRNGKGEVLLRLTPPPDAAPSEYPFRVRTGPLGGVLTPRNLILYVEPLPAVRVGARETRVWVGPWGRVAPFSLTVENIGNCDTAYRIAVKNLLLPPPPDPETRTDNEAPGAPRASSDLYETSRCRFLFDKEIDSLRRIPGNRPAKPDRVQLRLVRRKGWWWGWWEKDTVKVEAVPVTDPANSGKPGNAVHLKAVRWRLLPFPAFFNSLLSLALLILITSNPSDLSVTNALAHNGNYYVLQTARLSPEDPTKPEVKMTARLRWRAPPLAFVRLRETTGNETRRSRSGFLGSQADEVHVVREYGETRTTYSVDPAVGSASESVNVRFVPVRTRNKLQLSAGRLPAATALTPVGRSDLKVGGETIAGGEAIYQLDVPARHGADRPAILNLDNVANGLLINVWLAQKPEDIAVIGMKEDDSYQINPRQPKALKIYRSNADSPGDTPREIVFITTDAGHQKVRLKLRLVATPPARPRRPAPPPIQPPVRPVRPVPPAAPLPRPGAPSDYHWLSRRRVTEADLQGKSTAELRIMYNWIFARHGHVFRDPGLRAFFENQPWYAPGQTESRPSALERANLDRLRSRYEAPR
jgi:hypothetical protein